MEIKPLFTATATATGGRNGHTAADDGSVSVDLSVPKAMGGPEGLAHQLQSICSPPDMRPVLAEL
jgi:organic hydroperoxide reductase OsmC/OhrA